MKQFVDDLERQLTIAADAEAGRGPLGKTARAVASAGPRQITGVAIAIGVAAGGVAVLGSQVSGTPAEASLRVLSLPASNATAVQSRTPSLQNVAGDFSRARTFKSKNGTGYVTASPDGSKLCISIPDVDGFGTTCRPIAEVGSRGLGVSLIAVEGPTGPKSASNSQFAGVLPAGVDEAVVHVRGEPPRSQRYTDGVVVIDATRNVTVRWKTSDGTRSFNIVAREPAGRIFVDCGPGIGQRELRPGVKFDRRKFCAK